MDLSRRELFQLAGGAVASTLAARYASANEEIIRIGVIAPVEHAASEGFRRGVALGAEEARRTAELVGAGLELKDALVSSPGEAAAAARDLVSGGSVAVFGGIAGAYCEAVAAATPEAYLEVRARLDLTPGERAIRHLAINPGYQDHARTLVAGLQALGIKRYAVISPNPVLTESARSAGLREVQERDAQVLFTGQSHAGRDPLVADIVGPSSPGHAVPVAWHTSLRRYGAAELNDRYRSRFGAGMDENAWYGWLSVKLIVESALRGHPVAESRTDGHKGAGLSFAGGRLKQPLYVVITRPAEPNQEVVDV